MQLRRDCRFNGNDNGGFKASRRNAMSNWVSPVEIEPLANAEYDREFLDDHVTRMKCTDALVGILGSSDASDSSVLATISREFSSGCILHEAIGRGLPERILMLLAGRFPIFLAQVDGNGRHPVHVACAFGAPSKFVSHCIDGNPSSAAARDIEGKAPVHHLCQGTWRGPWDLKTNPAAEKNMIDILAVLYSKAPSSVVAEDHRGVGSVEYAIESDLGIKFIHHLQEKIGHFNENQARKATHRKCMAARRRLYRKSSPSAAFEA